MSNINNNFNILKDNINILNNKENNFNNFSDIKISINSPISNNNNNNNLNFNFNSNFLSLNYKINKNNEKNNENLNKSISFSNENNKTNEKKNKLPLKSSISLNIPKISIMKLEDDLTKTNENKNNLYGINIIKEEKNKKENFQEKKQQNEYFLSLNNLYANFNNNSNKDFSLTSKESFNSLEEWIQMANDVINGDYISGIVGNKNDLYLQAEVSEEEAEKFAKEKKMKFKLVSAKNDPQSFEDFLIELIKNIKFPEHHTKTVLSNKTENKKVKCC
jgi:hypothetical protein